MICLECGGYNELGTCLCDDYDFIDTEPEVNQICHFCGVDLFLLRPDSNTRMCVPCGLALDHEDCCVCVVCNNMILKEGNCSVCESCRSL